MKWNLILIARAPKLELEEAWNATAYKFNMGSMIYFRLRQLNLQTEKELTRMAPHPLRRFSNLVQDQARDTIPILITITTITTFVKWWVRAPETKTGMTGMGMTMALFKIQYFMLRTRWLKPKVTICATRKMDLIIIFRHVGI